MNYNKHGKGCQCDLSFFDCHTHTHFSHDSECDPYDSLKAAKENGIAGFAITDHCDIEFCGDRDVKTPIKKSAVCAHEMGDGVLAIKAELGVKIKAAYDNRELETLKKISSEILPELITRLNTFRDNLETQWLYENKPFGFVIQDIRIGGLLRRLKTAREKIMAYVNGSVKSLPELEWERLPYGNSNSGEVIFMNKWISTISAGKYQG